MIARALAVALAVVAVVVAVTAMRAERTCDADVARLGRPPVSEQLVQEAVDRCRDPLKPESVAVLLTEADSPGPTARRLADAIVRAHPEDVNAWGVLAIVARAAGDRATQDAALARAKRLDRRFALPD